MMKILLLEKAKRKLRSFGAVLGQNNIYSHVPVHNRHSFSFIRSPTALLKGLVPPADVENDV